MRQQLIEIIMAAWDAREMYHEYSDVNPRIAQFFCLAVNSN